MTRCHFLIVGGGIIGLTIAQSLLRRGVKDIVIIEKEKKIGQHASGRNSGVLHAGIYYTPNSLKARFCLEGNRMMKEYCLKNNLALRNFGKVIVSKNSDEAEMILELERRAHSCGAKAKLISSKELNEIEPYAKTVGQALYSPETAAVNPKQILACLEDELTSSGSVKIIFGAKLEEIDGNSAMTSLGLIEYEHLVNCAGAYADKISKKFGVGRGYRLVPFKGTYLKLKKTRNEIVRGNIYPVPDLRNPFLGVHLSRSFDDEVYIGPTAIPAFGRENYGLINGIEFEGLGLIMLNAKMFIVNKSFQKAVIEEPKKYIKRFVYKEAKKLVKGLQYNDIIKSSKVGIRPQLVDIRKMELVMDFKIIKGENSLHILNAISPAWTSSMSFSNYIVENHIFS